MTKKEIKDEIKFDWTITARKMLTIFIITAVPAGLVAIVPVIENIGTLQPEYAVFIPLIATFVIGIANWIKHK